MALIAGSRYIIALKLCTTMKAKDVTDTLHMALDVYFRRDKQILKKRQTIKCKTLQYRCLRYHTQAA
ncbi:hypothetical protein ACQU0X_10585 [Pseudovibrio ascidiaceicola]|uniref:hypothetical protein n=1 Tax=Pseudovibrio ascidiaceicola TaxID=285279 RepID=UPI003D363681